MVGVARNHMGQGHGQASHAIMDWGLDGCWHPVPLSVQKNAMAMMGQE